MLREGYVIVDHKHPLFPDDVIRSIEQNAKQIIAHIERRYNLVFPPIRFVITATATAGATPSQVAKIIFSNGPYPDVRLLFSEQPIAGEIIKDKFPHIELLVLFQEVSGSTASCVAKSVTPSIPRILIRQDNGARAIEDLIVDIRLSNFFRQTTAVGSLVSQRGLPELFRNKAKFARKYPVVGWLHANSAKARYAILAALNTVADEDLEGRAEAAYQTWMEFASWLTIAPSVARPPSVRSQAVPTGRTLAALPKIGQQLPVKRITTAARKLPPGEYTLVVLRRGSASRKSPSLRGRIRHLFGLHARINSFRILAEDVFLSERQVIFDLQRSGHVALIRIAVTNESIGVITST